MLASASMAARRAAIARSALPRVTTAYAPFIAPAAVGSIRSLPTKPPQPLPSQSEEPKQSEDSSSSASSSSSCATIDARSPRRSSSDFDIDTTLATIAEDAAQDAQYAAKGRTGAKARSRRNKSSGPMSGFWIRALGLGLLGLGGAELYHLSEEWRDDKERELFAGNSSGDSPFGRIKLRLAAMYEDFNAPVWDKLLPDPLPFPYQRPYTLVVELDELLVHSHWTREHGWRTAKRPGLDVFLGYLSQFWEIVIYTSQPAYAVSPIIEKLDPDRRWIAYTLFRESCRTMPDGTMIKDLSRLNRDLSKVLVLDTKPDGFSQHQDNGIVIRKWNGRKDDRELIDLLPFLEAIGIYAIPDVRSTVKVYAGVHVPTEYNKRQREEKEKEWADWQAKKASGGAGGRGWLGSLFSSSSSSSSLRATDGPPKTWFDSERERFRQSYAEDEKFWRENGERLRKEAQEEQEKRMKEMGVTILDVLTGRAFRQPQQQPSQ